MLIAHNPETIAAPAARYHHGVEVPAGARLLFISGQVGMRPDGTVGKDAAEQAELVWGNLLAIMQSAGMGVTDLAKITTYVIAPEYIDPLRRVRERVLGAHKPASTLLVVKALGRPEWLLEVEAYCAKAR
jgi:2-iminobutanoate/2-iminopropanoate deaminase